MTSRAETLLAERVTQSVEGVKRVVNNLNAPDETPPLAAKFPSTPLSERRGYGITRSPSRSGAADRIRTGDVQLGKLAFCH